MKYRPGCITLLLGIVLMGTFHPYGYLGIFASLPAGFLFFVLGLWCVWPGSKPAWIKQLDRISGGLILINLLILLFFIGQTRTKSYEMTWNSKGFMPEGSGYEPAQEMVCFTYARYPQYSECLQSNDIAAYLRQEKKKTVFMTIEATYDFFQLRGYRETHLDGRPITLNGQSDGSHFKIYGGYNGRSGEPSVQPYDWGSMGMDALQ